MRPFHSFPAPVVPLAEVASLPGTGRRQHDGDDPAGEEGTRIPTQVSSSVQRVQGEEP